jgi:hypothetical protein
MAGARIYNEKNQLFYQRFTEKPKEDNIKTVRKEMARYWRRGCFQSQ